MPPKAVKTIRDLIFWEYAKLISGSALQDRKNYGFVMHNFKKLQSGEKKWSAVLREDLQMDPARCAYCGGTEELSNDHIVPKRECHFSEIHNIVKACRRCNSSKGDKDLIEWWGIDRRYELPRVVYGKYLKMLYLCHECRGTLDKEDINLDCKIDLFDLGAIFHDPCDPEKVRRQNLINPLLNP
ncbi:MAG: HNH endonuclease [Candidatus Omnitrophica bacterium]|nr:HNH endonuclease [Candidatus Omnitrophota bacterium]